MQDALDRIPINFDVFTEMFLVSSVVSLVLGFVVLLRSGTANRIFGLLSLLLFMLAALMMDLYLVRSGLMKYYLWYNDLTEWMVISLGPCLYLICKSLLSKSALSSKEIGIHFMAPFLYMTYQFFDILQPIEHKYNSYVSAFYPDLPYIEVDYSVLVDPLMLKEYFEKLILLSLLGYAFAGILMVIRHEQFPSWQNLKSSFSKYTFILWSFGSLIANGVSLLFLFILFEEDQSHLYVGMLVCMEVFLLFGLMTGSSIIFQSSWVLDKYDTSGLVKSKSKKLLVDINKLVEREKLYMDPKLSLSKLSDELKISSNHISQAINMIQGQNFNEYINSFRIRESMDLLRSEDFDHLTIEGIGQKVGFSSKSAFYSAFKKVTNTTPVSFKKSGKPNSGPL